MKTFCPYNWYTKSVVSESVVYLRKKNIPRLCTSFFPFLRNTQANNGSGDEAFRVIWAKNL